MKDVSCVFLEVNGSPSVPSASQQRVVRVIDETNERVVCLGP